MSSRSATLDLLAKQMTTVEWTIYPTGWGTFACGSPDGRELRDGQALDMLLGGRWIAGFIEHLPHAAARFIAQDDQRPCGLCPEMRVRLLTYQSEEQSR